MHIANRGVRGATTVKENTPESFDEATVELLKEILANNEFKVEDISHVIFTLTHDINAAFPAKTARDQLGWDNVPMICTQEIPVPNSLEKCIRVLIVINTKLENTDIKHIYLREAKKLRPDLSM